MYMIFFVLNDPNRLNDVLETLERVGTRGVTIVESTGMHRVQRKYIPMRYTSSFSNLEGNNLTLFAIVQNDGQARACLYAIEQVVGNLDDPNTGVFAAWPLTLVKGLPALEA